MKDEILNDWSPETRSLLRRLKESGFNLIKSHNGEDGYKCVQFGKGPDEQALIDNLTACDEAHLWIERGGDIAERYCLFLVYGNSPGELVCDYSFNAQREDRLEAVTSAHYEEWSERKQPTILFSEKYPDLFKARVERAASL